MGIAVVGVVPVGVDVGVFVGVAVGICVKVWDPLDIERCIVGGDEE